jgi:hypothetical protein
MSATQMNKKKRVNSSIFSFIKDNVLSITDITRSNKLSEILNQYAGKETSEVYVIQNNKNRDAVGVLVDLEHYERLLKLQEAIDQATDEYMYQIALSRKDDKATVSLLDVVEDADFNLDELTSSLSDVELDEN